jgi:hypothetical protein
LVSIALTGDTEVKSGVFNLSEYPGGMYVIRVQDGQKIHTRKISKIK